MRLAIGLLLLGGCAENAVLELELTHPPAPADETGLPWYAVVDVHPGAGDFTEDFEGTSPAGATLLDATDFRSDCISVETTEPDQELDILVSYCRDPACAHPLDRGRRPSTAFHIDVPFYRARHTFFTDTIGRLPLCASDDDCELGVCLSSGRCGCADSADCCPAGGCTADGPQLVCSGSVCYEDVSYCRIGGCIDNNGPNFCDDDGVHYCELYDDEARPRSYTGCHE